MVPYTVQGEPQGDSWPGTRAVVLHGARRAPDERLGRSSYTVQGDAQDVLKRASYTVQEVGRGGRAGGSIRDGRSHSYTVQGEARDILNRASYTVQGEPSDDSRRVA